MLTNRYIYIPYTLYTETPFKWASADRITPPSVSPHLSFCFVFDAIVFLTVHVRVFVCDFLAFHCFFRPFLCHFVLFCFVRPEAATREKEKTRKGTGKLEGLNTDIECKPWGASKTRGKGE